MLYSNQRHYLLQGAGSSTIRGEGMMPPWELTVMPYDADDSLSDQPSLDELISLREAAELSGLSASHLALLVRRGDIWGVKVVSHMIRVGLFVSRQALACVR